MWPIFLRDIGERPRFDLPVSTIDLEGKKNELIHLVEKNSDQLGLARFSLMVNGLSVKQIVDFFIALLFLVNENVLNAWQETLFGEIMVSLVSEEERGRKPVDSDEELDD